MWQKDLNVTENRLLLLLGQFIALLLCIGYIEYVYVTNITPDKQAEKTFVKTDCILMSKKLMSKDKVAPRFRADFLVNYNVKGVQYNRWVSGNGLDQSYSQDLGEQEDVLTQYNVGEHYACWYNPEDPQTIILVKRHNWLSTLSLLAPAGIGTVVFYFFIKNLFMLMGFIKRPPIKKKKGAKH